MPANSVADPLSSVERAALMEAPRPRRSLPTIAPTSARVHLPLAERTRPEDRAARPNYAVWELTLACDLSCRHCGSRAGRARADELSTAEAIDLAGQMADLGVQEVALIGGEAYLHEGWTEVIAAIRARRMQCTLVTGGRGMTAERARAAARAGVQSVAVSIDGAEATHDRLRASAGSYAAAVAALGRCREAGMQVAVNTQINRLSVADLPHVLDVLLREGARGWQLQLTVPVGRAADEPEVLLQPYDLVSVFPLLAELKARCDANNVILLAGNNIGYFGPYEHILRSYCRGGHRGSCEAGLTTLGIEANGDIKGCPSLPTASWVGGNIREHRLKDIWERSAPLRHTRDRTRAELWGYCAECYYGDECRAGCTWMTTALHGRPGNNPYCHHRALEMQKAGKREHVVRVSEAPGLPFDHALWEVEVRELLVDADAHLRTPDPGEGADANTDLRTLEESGPETRDVAPRRH
jgi:radical SAM protein with 4Fe4S-binding SPASM domain